MEEGLEIDNILDPSQIDLLFDEDEESSSIETAQDDAETTETTDVENLSTEESESVGSEDEEESLENGEDTNSEEGKGTSPKKNFYSSIALALKEEGIFPDLDDDDTEKIKEPEDLVDVIEKQIQSRLDEKQRRIDQALEAGVEVEDIKRYENTVSYLESIEDKTLLDETEKGENLRKQLIYQDFINRGYSKERAQREVQKSFNAGTDIEDAKEALNSNKEYFKSEYDSLIEETKKEEERELKERKAQAESLKKSILEDKSVFGELQVDRVTRQKIYDSISKPVYKDPDTGDYYTAIQKYEKENRIEFLKNIGLVFTLTNGFKNLDGLVKGKVRKEVNKGLRELEHTLNNTTRSSSGNLRFAGGTEDDPESFIGKGWDLDV